MNDRNHQTSNLRRLFLKTTAAALSAMPLIRIGQAAGESGPTLLPRGIDPYPNEVA